jgi:hypothetical protein
MSTSASIAAKIAGITMS